MLIDSHTHLYVWKDEDIPAVLEEARQAGVRSIICLGTMPETCERTLQLAKTYDMVYPAVGIHPSRIKTPESIEPWVALIKRLALANEVRFIGEIGLEKRSSLEKYYELQKDIYKEQLRLAAELDLPVNSHGGHAHSDHVAILKEVGVPAKGGVIHSFDGNLGELNSYLDLGMSISIGFPANAGLPGHEEIIRMVPEDRFVLETDAAAPVSSIGARSVPARLAFIAERVAALRGTTLEHISEKSQENLERMCGPFPKI